MAFEDDTSSEMLSSEKDGLRVLSIYIIRSVVKRYQGEVEEDTFSRSIDVSVPDADAASCAEAIGEQMGLMCYCMYAQIDALFNGKLPAGFSQN